jgi:hypothetical protein
MNSAKAVKYIDVKYWRTTRFAVERTRPFDGGYLHQRQYKKAWPLSYQTHDLHQHLLRNFVAFFLAVQMLTKLQSEK